MIPVRVTKERDDALQDVSEICNEYGDDICIYVRGESNITRDKYNSIIKEELSKDVKYNFKAYPIERTPNQKQMEKAGIREKCEAIVWISMLNYLNYGLDFDFLEDEKIMVTVDGNDYGIRDKNKISQHGDQYAYITIGIYRK
jgi:hypothetical protein